MNGVHVEPPSVLKLRVTGIFDWAGSMDPLIAVELPRAID